MSVSFPDLLKENSEAKDDRMLVREETDGFWLVRFLDLDVCNSKGSGGRGSEDFTPLKYLQMDWRGSLVVECLPSIHRTLASQNSGF